MKELSIIIPHYNSVNSLEKLLSTIPLSEKIQVIIIDDNSNEISKKKLLELKQKYNDRIELLFNDRKIKGAGTCRNIGLDYAKGKWILFADADDYFINGFFKVISKYLNSDFDVVFFTPTSVETDTGNLSDRHLLFENLINEYLQFGKEKELLLRYRYVVPWSKLIRRSFLDKYKITFDEVISANDVMFSTKVGYYMQKFTVSKEVIYCVTKSKGSLTTINSYEIFMTRLLVFVNYYNYLKSRLTKHDFKILGLSGRGYLINAFHYGIKKVFKVLKILISNKIKILDKEILNPINFIKKVLSFIRKQKYEKSFSTKEFKFK